MPSRSAKRLQARPDGNISRRGIIGDILNGPKSLVEGILNPGAATTSTSQVAPSPTTKPAETPRTQAPKPTSAPKATSTPTPKPTPTPAPIQAGPSPTTEKAQTVVTTKQVVTVPDPAPVPSSTPSPTPLPVMTAQPQEHPQAPSSSSSSSASPIITAEPEEAHLSVGVPTDLFRETSTIPSTTSTSISPKTTSTAGEPAQAPSTSSQDDGNSNLPFKLALGFGITCKSTPTGDVEDIADSQAVGVLALVALFLFLWRRRRQRRLSFAQLPNNAHPYDKKPPLPPLNDASADPEAGYEYYHEHHHYHEFQDQPSQFDREATTAAWAQHSPPPPEPESETGIIKIFRWPTLSTRSTMRSTMRSTLSSSNNEQYSTQSGKLKPSSSRASRSTISTMLRKSRRDIAGRAETANAALEAAALEEKMRMMDADSPQPSPIPSPNPLTSWPEPLVLPQQKVKPTELPPPGIRRKPVQKQRQSLARQSLAKQRQSVASIASSGGASIASSSVFHAYFTNTQGCRILGRELPQKWPVVGTGVRPRRRTAAQLEPLQSPCSAPSSPSAGP
ncbi:hypothetical protein EV126DRAFT_348202 [Verticillium dahliae]|nr:hypothetical protein EV126DRAFT_348202 [Verticillium dahliae]